MEFGKTTRSIIMATAVLGTSALSGGCSAGERPSFNSDGAENVCSVNVDDFHMPERPARDPNNPYVDPEEKDYAQPLVPRLEIEDSLQGFRVSNSFEESKDKLNKIFDDVDIKFHVGEIPNSEGTRDSPEEIDQHLLDVSARHIVEELVFIPKELLKETYSDGADFYLSTNVTYEGEVQSNLIDNSPGERFGIILSLDPDIQTGSEFLKVTSLLLGDRLCRPDYEGKHPNNYSRLNSETFRYANFSNYDEDVYNKVAWENVVSPDAMASPGTDFDEVVKYLLAGYKYTKLNDCRDSNRPYQEDISNTPLCRKLRLVLGEIALIDYDSAKQLATQL